MWKKKTTKKQNKTKQKQTETKRQKKPNKNKNKAKQKTKNTLNVGLYIVLVECHKKKPKMLNYKFLLEECQYIQKAIKQIGFSLMH